MRRFTNLLFVVLLLVLATTGVARAQTASLPARVAQHSAETASLLDATHIIDLRQGSYLSSLARSLSNGGFETATGQRVEFRPWYSSRWTDTHITWMTLLTPNVSLIHGFSTGERGAKYVIAPSLKIGIAVQREVGRGAVLYARAVTTVGGTLREKPCSADYGDIGGMQPVNCRLAASLLPPDQTLDLLVRERPINQHQVNVMFAWRF